MPTCGSCKAEHQPISHIRECYESKRGSLATLEVSGFAQQYVESRDFKPMALDVPDSKYAMNRPHDGVLEFFEVRTGKGKWAGFQFLDRLIGSPGDWRKAAIKGLEKRTILEQISEDPKAAAVRYSREFTVCAVCSSPLSDPESVASGLGPICARRF